MRKIIVRPITFLPGFGATDCQGGGCKALSSTPNKTRIGRYVARLSGWCFSYYA